MLTEMESATYYKDCDTKYVLALFRKLV